MNIIPEEECSNHEEIIAELTKRNEFLTKLVFWGKMTDYVFDSLSAEGAKIYMMNLQGKKQEIFVTKHTTIRDIKRMMEEFHAVPWHRNRILQNCQELENHRTLLGLGIPANAVLQYSVHPNTKLYPPLEESTKKQREEIAHDKFIMNEHILKRDRQFQECLREKRVNYHLSKKGHSNFLQLL